MEEVKKFPLWKQAVIDAVEEFGFGDIIKHKWLYENFDIYPPAVGTASDFKEFQLQYMSSLEMFKKSLLEDNSMMLKPIRGKGYLVVQPRDQSDMAWDDFKNVLRKEIRRADTRLKYVDRLYLNNDELKNNTDKLVRISMLKQLSRGVFHNELNDLQADK